MHAMAIMAKIARQLAIQIGCHLESGDFDELAEMAKSRQRAGEFMVIVFVCLVPVCILLTSMHAFVPCE